MKDKSNEKHNENDSSLRQTAGGGASCSSASLLCVCRGQQSESQSYVQIDTWPAIWTDVRDYVKSALYCCISVKLLHTHLW